MSATDKSEKKDLVDTLIDEASDILLICYLAYSGGSPRLRDLFEALKDAESLSTDDLRYNLEIVRQKKGEAYRDPMRPVFEQLMKLDGGQRFAVEALEMKPKPGAQDRVH